MYHILCIHYSVKGHLDSFQILTVTNKAAMNIVEKVALLYVGEYFGYTPRSGITGSSGNTMSDILRNGHTDFQSGCTCLQCQPQYRNVPLSPHPHQFLLTWDFDLSHSDRCEIESQGSFDLHFSDDKDIEYFLRCQSAIQYSSTENSLLSSVPPF